MKRADDTNTFIYYVKRIKQIFIYLFIKSCVKYSVSSSTRIIGLTLWVMSRPPFLASPEPFVFVADC